jgi:hypothetical protein
MRERSDQVSGVVMAGRVFLSAIMVTLPLATMAEALELPKEVTPELRRACEKDVRRLCIRKGSTIATVKSCVIANFSKLNARCKMRLVRAGL